MTNTRRIVIDVLLPLDPSVLSFTKRIAAVESVSAVTMSLIELDREVQNLKLTLVGDDLDFDAIEAAIGEAGGSVHSIDQVTCGEYVVEDSRTPQDT